MAPARDAAGAQFSWKQTAQDGIQLNWNNYAAANNQNPAFNLDPANRVDLLVQAPAISGEYELRVSGTPAVVGAPPITLLRIRVQGEAIEPAMGFPGAITEFPSFPTSLSDIDPATIHVRREITFETQGFRGNGQPGTGAGRAGYPGMRASKQTIDGAQFLNNLINQTMVQDTAEEWTLINRTLTPQTPPRLVPPGSAPRVAPFGAFSHPFHIHINPFQVVEIFDPTKMDEPQRFDQDFRWFDTIGIPPAYDYYPDGRPRLGNEGKRVFVNGHVKIRSRFADFTGLFVLHCHILAHEDRGMMQLVQVVPNRTMAEHYH